LPAAPACLPYLLVALLLAGPSRPSGERADRPETELAVEAALAGRVSAQRAAERVRALCAFGPRMGGTRSGERAASYLREAFEAMGLDVRVLEDPPRRCHEESAWRVTAHPQESEPFELHSAWPYGFSPSAEGSARLDLDVSEGSALLAARPPRIRSDPTTAATRSCCTCAGRSPSSCPTSASPALTARACGR
jgi:hypothetical protein